MSMGNGPQQSPWDMDAVDYATKLHTYKEELLV